MEIRYNLIVLASMSSYSACFNPCCNGSDVELYRCTVSKEETSVLILVVMEMM